MAKKKGKTRGRITTTNKRVRSFTPLARRRKRKITQSVSNTVTPYSYSKPKKSLQTSNKTKTILVAVRKNKNKSPLLTKKEKKQTMVCVNRQVRREVLHANKKTGKAGQKKPNWTELSRIKCKRK